MKERDSNIELLRIVATLFIIIVHCNGWFLMQWGGVNDWFAHGNAVGISRILIQNITGLGVPVFILISGFYGIRPKLKSIVNLFTCLLFFYVGCYLFNCYRGHEAFAVKNLIENILAFSYVNWFINCYLFLMLLSPMINAFVDAVDTKRLGLYTLLYSAAILYFGYYRNNGYWPYNEGYSVVMMVGVYLLGRYMNRINEWIDGVKYSYIAGAFVGMIGVMCVIRAFSSHAEMWLHYGSPITMFAAALLFVLFYKLPKFHNKFINWVGASCLAGYVLHTCSPMVQWLARKDVAFFMNDAYLVYCLKMIMIIGYVFILAITLDKIRLLIFKPLITWSGKIKALN